MLQPLKFMPLFKNKIWGGNKIKTLGFDYAPLPNCGEMWILSSVKGNESVVAEGPFEENTLNEMIEVYMGDLVGDRNYERFGNTFPLLIKIIDANDRLSIQVHPNDDLARERGMDNGKTEMWYVLEAEEGAMLTDGFERTITREEYEKLLAEQRLEEVLHVEHPKQGDVYFIPAGRIHSIGKGLMLAEIQQTSDCTYRVYDYNRLDSNGRPRELHTAQALDAFNFEATTNVRQDYTPKPNDTATVVQCPYFCTNFVDIEKPVVKDLTRLESFLVYICVEGIMAVRSMDVIIPLHEGECLLIPAVADKVELFATGHAKALEVYVDPELAPDDGLTHKYDNDWLAEFMNQQRSLLDDMDLDNNHHHHDCNHDHDCDCNHDHDCDCGHHHDE